VEGAFSCYYQHSAYIIPWQEQIRFVVQQMPLLTYGFHVRVHGVSPPPHGASAPRWGGAPHFWGFTNTQWPTTV